MNNKFAPKKKFGQHFLINQGVINKIIETTDLKKNDQILEIGPGQGQLTFQIAKKVRKITAIEKDAELIELLKEKIINQKIKNIEILNADALKIDPKKYKNYKLIANLPYYITGQFLRIFMPHRHKNSILMLQKEVAQRIISKEPNHSILSLSIQIYGEPKILFSVKSGSFYPKPKIDSAVIKITPKKTEKINYELFFKLLKAGFASKRQTLNNNLARKLKIKKEIIGKILHKAEINLSSRAQELKLEEWIKLTKII